MHANAYIEFSIGNIQTQKNFIMERMLDVQASFTVIETMDEISKNYEKNA